MATEHVNLSAYDKAAFPSAKDYRIAVVTAEWNGAITSNLKQGALDALIDCGVPTDHITSVSVPGAFELPSGAQMALRNLRIDAAICLGAVIRGETAHFEYVCQGVTVGIQQVALAAGRPVIFGVLTDDHIDQSRARSGGKHGNKGTEAAITALKMIALNKEHDGSSRARLGFG